MIFHTTVGRINGLFPSEINVCKPEDEPSTSSLPQPKVELIPPQ